MAHIDVPGRAGTYAGTVEIILRAFRLGLLTAAEARTLIAQIRPHGTASLVSIQDGGPAGVGGQSGQLRVIPVRTVR